MQRSISCRVTRLWMSTGEGRGLCYCGRLWTGGRDWKCRQFCGRHKWMTHTSGIDYRFVASSHCHFAVIHSHITHCSFMLFDLVLSENKLSLIYLTFTGTLNQFHFTLLFVLTIQDAPIKPTSIYAMPGLELASSLWYVERQKICRR
jgi:hypothetical protein